MILQEYQRKLSEGTIGNTYLGGDLCLVSLTKITFIGLKMISETLGSGKQIFNFSKFLNNWLIFKQIIKHRISNNKANSKTNVCMIVIHCPLEEVELEEVDLFPARLWGSESSPDTGWMVSLLTHTQKGILPLPL